MVLIKIISAEDSLNLLDRRGYSRITPPWETVIFHLLAGGILERENKMYG